MTNISTIEDILESILGLVLGAPPGQLQLAATGTGGGQPGTGKSGINGGFRPATVLGPGFWLITQKSTLRHTGGWAPEYDKDAVTFYMWQDNGFYKDITRLTVWVGAVNRDNAQGQTSNSTDPSAVVNGSANPVIALGSAWEQIANAIPTAAGRGTPFDPDSLQATREVLGGLTKHAVGIALMLALELATVNTRSADFKGSAESAWYHRVQSAGHWLNDIGVQSQRWDAALAGAEQAVIDFITALFDARAKWLQITPAGTWQNPYRVIAAMFNGSTLAYADVHNGSSNAWDLGSQYADTGGLGEDENGNSTPLPTIIWTPPAWVNFPPFDAFDINAWNQLDHHIRALWANNLLNAFAPVLPAARRLVDAFAAAHNQLSISDAPPLAPLPMPNSLGATNVGNPYANIGNPYANIGNPFANIGNPFANIGNPFANVGNPFANVGNPFANVGNPFANVGNPFANIGGGGPTQLGANDPYANNLVSGMMVGGGNPFANTGTGAAVTGGADPFANSPGSGGFGTGSSPFGTGGDGLESGMLVPGTKLGPTGLDTGGGPFDTTGLGAGIDGPLTSGTRVAGPIASLVKGGTDTEAGDPFANGGTVSGSVDPFGGAGTGDNPFANGGVVATPVPITTGGAGGIGGLGGPFGSTSPQNLGDLTSAQLQQLQSAGLLDDVPLTPQQAAYLQTHGLGVPDGTNPTLGQLTPDQLAALQQGGLLDQTPLTAAERANLGLPDPSGTANPQNLGDLTPAQLQQLESAGLFTNVPLTPQQAAYLQTHGLGVPDGTSPTLGQLTPDQLAALQQGGLLDQTPLTAAERANLGQPDLSTTTPGGVPGGTGTGTSVSVPGFDPGTGVSGGVGSGVGGGLGSGVGSGGGVGSGIGGGIGTGVDTNPFPTTVNGVDVTPGAGGTGANPPLGNVTTPGTAGVPGVPGFQIGTGGLSSVPGISGTPGALSPSGYGVTIPPSGTGSGGPGVGTGAAGADGAAGASGALTEGAGAGSPYGGMPYMPGMMGGGAPSKEDRERQRSTWLKEDEEVWGTDPDCAPAVIGRRGRSTRTDDDEYTPPTDERPDSRDERRPYRGR